ncbi:MAG: hypothetical protein LBB36_04135 [Fibromonadaceae bacterium]|jgi:hypothetical protein|nr:hypothetical protein [Fibromonadaceae bacterium]
MRKKLPLDREYNYFISNQNELVRRYNKKILVIRENSVVGSYKTFEKAYNDAVKKYPLGTFLIQECVAGEKAYTTYCYFNKANG